MKILNSLVSLAVIALLLASCGTSNQGFGTSSIQKRKYTKGFYFNRNSGLDVKKDASKFLKEKSDESGEIRQDSKPEADESAVTNLTQESSVAEIKLPEVQEPIPVDKKSAPKVSEKDSDIDLNTLSHSSTPIRNKSQAFKKHKDPALAKQKKQQNNSAGGRDSLFILAVIFAILIPPIGVLIYTNIDWVKVLICLILTVIFYVPGMIYALLVVFDVL